MKRNGLICVKSIMTIVLTVALCVLTFMYPEEYAETMKACVTMVVTFYFAHQVEKAEVKRNAAENIQGGKRELVHEGEAEPEGSYAGENSEEKV